MLGTQPDRWSLARGADARQRRPRGLATGAHAAWRCSDPCTVCRAMLHARIDISEGLDGEPVVLACFDLGDAEIAASAHAVAVTSGERFRTASLSVDDVLELRELTALVEELRDLALRPGISTVVLAPRAAVGLPRRRRALRGDARRGRVAARGGPRAARARPRPARPARGALRRSSPRRALPAGAAPLLRGGPSAGAGERPAAARHVGRSTRSRKGSQVGRWPALGRRRSPPWSLSDSARRSPASAAARRVVVAPGARAREMSPAEVSAAAGNASLAQTASESLRAWPGNGVGWVVELTPRAGLQPRARKSTEAQARAEARSPRQ